MKQRELVFTRITKRAKVLFCMVFLCNWLNAQQHNKEILFENVSVFDGKNELILTNQHVLISGNKIALISKTALPKNDNMIVIDGKGKTLIPGLIDVHVHMIFGALSMKDMMDPNLKPENLLMKVVPEAKKMLLRGFTSVRDVGGPSFQLKQSIDDGTIQGPRIWPSGAMISQTSGHGDLRLPEERSRRFFGPISKAENFGASFIADGTAEVLTAVRENLRFGASQIKLMAGGGTSSAYDPVDVTQYTLEEMKAAVEAAEDWGTYVTVHAYTPRAVRKAIDAGVKCIEHGQLLDKSTLKLIKRKGIWLSCQNLIDNTPEMSELRKEKRKPVVDGQKMIWPLAKKMKIKLAWGTDFLFEPWLNEEQNSYLLKLKEWFTPYEILKMVTHDNAQLLSLSGNRSPYPGELGVIKQGALADLILIDGNPLEDIDLIAQPNDKFLVILKDGRVEKNLLE
ncbi:metal-dependent hydrolase family protein [Flavobacterium tibetense]|nr:amidohydrolase family protein [Flavobacterium tibetense]